MLKKVFDSTLYYYQKSYDLKVKYKDPILFLQYINFGDYYRNQKEYDRALDYYLKAIDNIKEHSVNSIQYNYLYKNIADLYGILGDKEKQNQFETVFTIKEGEIAANRSESMDYALSIIVDDTENRYETSEKKNISGFLLEL
ncbi:tetratricopeptide repeat protein [Chryseobacterium wanjuense]